MRKRIWSFVLTLGILLAMKPEVVMAAKMERIQTAVQQSAGREEQADQPETDTAETYGVPTSMEGSGTPEDPYRIKNAGQLRAFADMVNGVGGARNTGLCAVLTQNIDLSGVCGADIGSWTPIGADPHPYTGIFDGGSFAVSGLCCHKPDSSCVGLFGSNAGTIKNVGVVGADIDASSYTGGVCGFNAGTVTGCYNSSTVSGESSTGGVCGYNDGGGTVSSCYNTGAVSGSQYVGGVCGYNKNVTSNSYNTGTVNGISYSVGAADSGGTYVGGICGYNRKLISGCYNTGEVGGKDYVGSVCGYNHPECTIRNCYYLVTGTEKGNYGVAMTRQQFASGEVCWLLNERKSENVVWYQTCGMGFPAFGGKVVYQVQRWKAGGRADELTVAYTNEKETGQAAVSAAESSSGSDTVENADGHMWQEPEWKWKEYREARAVFTCLDCGEQLSLKASISKKETAATCATEGEKVYTASVERDGETYEDIKTVKIEKTGHRPLVQKLAEPATCEKSGISQDCWMCPACRKYFVDQQGTEEIPRNEVVIKALGHEYPGEPEWSWTSDYSRFTAKFVCARSECGKTDEIETKPRVESTATCMTEGETTYRATVKFNGKKYNRVETVVGEKLPHDYSRGPEWIWKSDYSGAEAVFSCAYRCGTKETVPAIVTEKETIKPTCMSAGKITHTAAVTFGGEEYTDVRTETLARTEHSYGEPELEVDYPTATFIFTCTDCEKATSVRAATVTKSETQGEGCGVPGTVTYRATVTFNGKLYEKTKVETMPAEHNLTHYNAREATCMAAGNEEYWKCGNCGKFFADEEGEEEIPGIPDIPKTDHKTGPEGPEWKWEDDYSGATAVCICVYGCGTKETRTAKVTEKETTKPTCMSAGEITYTAAVTFGGEEYTDIRTKTLAKTDHNYGEPEWMWAEDFSTASAVFTCTVCGTSKSEEGVVTKTDTPGTSCGQSGEVTFTAQVTFNGQTYTDVRVEKIFVEHALTHHEAGPATCIASGNKEYWKCDKCGKSFWDEEGTDEITDSSEIQIPAEGHKLKHWKDDLYECTECGEKFTITVAPDGTKRVCSAEDGAALRTEENDSNVGSTDPAEDKQSEEESGAEDSTGEDLSEAEPTGQEKPEEKPEEEPDGSDLSKKEPVEAEPPVESGPEEGQDGSAPPAADAQDGQNGENEPGGPDGQGAPGEAEGQDTQAGEIGEDIPAEQAGQEESSDGITDAQENAARYGIIYPEGVETESDTVTESAWEGNEVRFRAESDGTEAAQTIRKRKKYPLWILAAALAVLTGGVFLFVLRRENH